MLFDRIGEKGIDVLDHGYIELINSNINTEIITAALNDFPDPTKAFNHGSMSFFIRMPIHVFRQWIRHRSLHFTELEMNFDRVVSEDAFYVPDRFRKQTGKIGHYTFVDMDDTENEVVRQLFTNHIELCKNRYLRLRGLGLPGQLAATNLPYAFYVDTILTCPLGGLANFLSLRTDSHAQKEIQAYAFPIWRFFKEKDPITAESFAKFMYYGDSDEIKNFLFTDRPF